MPHTLYSFRSNGSERAGVGEAGDTYAVVRLLRAHIQRANPVKTRPGAIPQPDAFFYSLLSTFQKDR